MDTLTSNGKKWGWFAADGAPIATGDRWYKWECSRRDWVDSGYTDPYTGEWVDEGKRPVDCPIKNDTCTRCGNRYVYP